MKVSDIMTPKVVSIRPEASILQAIRLMLQHGISGLPVLDSADKLVGIITEGDLLRRAEIHTEIRRPRWIEFLLGPGCLADDYVHAHGRKVADVMSTDVVAIPENASLEEVVQLIEKRRIKRLPVMRGERLVGLVSRANLLHALAATAREIASAPLGDEKIRERLVAEEMKQPWARPIQTNFTVRKGVVHLWGVIMSEEQRQALKVMAENVPGVKEVRDHLAWLEPISGMTIDSVEDSATSGGAEPATPVSESPPLKSSAPG